MTWSGVHDKAGPPHSWARAFGLTAGSVAATWALALLAHQEGAVAGRSAPADLDRVLITGLLWGAVALCGWLACVATITLLSAAPGALGRGARRLAAWLTPHCARRALSLALGVSVGTVALPAPMALAAVVEVDAPATAAGSAAGTATLSGNEVTGPGFRPSAAAESPADAAEAAEPAEAAGSQGATSSPGPGWVPDRPAKVMRSGTAAPLGVALRPSATTIDTVTVRRGDSLWSIAARHLGPAASDAEIAAEWPRWYDANRDVIGDNPDVVEPGQLLRVPVAEVAR